MLRDQGTARRRAYTPEQRRQIVAETYAPGASVSVVARRHDVNANLVFKWRKGYEPKAALPALAMLPVEITPAVPAPTRSGAPQSRTRSARKGRIEITLANGHRVEVVGAVGMAVLRQVIETLAR